MRISDWSSDVCSSDLLDEQRPIFASQLGRVDIAGDIVLRADTRCLGVDILSTDRRGVPVGRGNGHHSINGPVDQIRSIERYAIVLVLKLFLLPVGGQPGLRATEIAVVGQRLIIAAMAFENGRETVVRRSAGGL